MPSEIPKQRTVDALRSVWASLDQLLDGLSDDEWRLASPLPGWDVQANVSHIIGTESFLLGEQPPVQADGGAIEHVRNPIGEMNEHWIASFADHTPADVLAAFRDRTERRLGALDAMSDEEWNTVGFTPAGEDVYGRFMQIRVFDCWLHEQDIRATVDRPGHESGMAVEVTLDEMSTAMGFVVGKKAGAAAGSSVTFDLTGESGRRIHVEVGERAAVVDALDGVATATLTMPVLSFARIGGGRNDAPEHASSVQITGDEALGGRVLANLGYTL